jgi:hypothetical protein
VAIHRGPLPTDSFTIISNAWLRDPRLSWKAKGLLAYIASHSAGHTLTTEQIIAEGTDGRDAVRAGLVELEAAGYLRRIVLRDQQGRAAGTDFELCDSGLSGAGKPVAGADQQEQGVSSAQDHSGKSGAGGPATKKTTNTKNTNKTTSATPRGTRLPEDWMPSDQTRTWCAKELPAELYARAGTELTKFRNYWCSKTGRDATKIDWDRTFMNWMINARDRYGVSPTSGAPVQHFPTTAERNATHRDRQMAKAKRAQELIDQGMNATDAYRQAGEEIAQNGMRGGSPIGYIDGEVIDRTPGEVTAT